MKKSVYHSDNVSGRLAGEILQAIRLTPTRTTPPVAAPISTPSGSSGARMAGSSGPSSDVYSVGFPARWRTGSARRSSAPVRRDLLRGDLAPALERVRRRRSSGRAATRAAFRSRGGRQDAVATLRGDDRGGRLAGGHDPPGRASSASRRGEAGTVYTGPRGARSWRRPPSRNMLVHMDSARFANAIARLGARRPSSPGRPASILSFGATKNSALQRGGGRLLQSRPGRDACPPPAPSRPPFSKMRLMSGPVARLPAGRPLARSARHANAMAARVASGPGRPPRRSGSPHPTEINFVLTALPKRVWDGLVADRYSFSRRGAPSERRRPDRVRLGHVGRGGRARWSTPPTGTPASSLPARRHGSPTDGEGGAAPASSTGRSRPRRPGGLMPVPTALGR